MTLFTPRISPVIEIRRTGCAFFETWCPKTNTVLTSIGELSISLWDLYILGGLPIGGSLYEEIILGGYGTHCVPMRKIKDTLLEEGDFIRPGTFKIATMMAIKRKISLAVPALASICNGLNEISSLPQLDLVKIRFPIQYVYDRLKVKVIAVTRIVVGRSPSRTLIVLIKESNSSGALPREGRRKVSESKIELPIYKSIQQTAVSVFDGKKIVLPLLKKKSKHNRPYMIWDMEAARKEFSITAGERLSNAMLEEYDKIEKSFILQYLNEVKEKIEKLRIKEKDPEILLDATERESWEAKLGVSTAEKDFDACNDADLLNSDDLTDLEQKKERLEAMRQDYMKLCLD
ncbi:hypothetical protein HAX54_043038 [Datura stramonium]|uniref:Uncharacterized protein n=1 Tax=Datura stramonium TaxID=4076 RepID=A0ABS8SN45_DATST|nr:hypothetical protein [Datura stramonium]